MWFKDKKVILVSGSPRRRELLTQAGIPFTVRKNTIEESFPAGMPVDEVAEFLARKKAGAARAFLSQPEEIILTADSVVILGQTIFGKPGDFEEAAHSLRMLSGKIHRVTTGVCLRSTHKEKCFSSTSHVHFEPLTEEEIRYYVETYKPYDKAGGYAIQEWIGLCKVSRIEGSYANIVGLPVDLVYRELAEF